jgi:D-serine deaminase-like pyridoxal phosphate-dependent protein
VTEVQAGGGIFGDVHYRENYGIAHRCALTVLSSVTSRPNPTRIVCDAGKKTMTGDTAMPRPLGLGEVTSVRLSAEHATIELAAPDTTLRVADPLAFEIGYSETSLALHDWLYAARGGRIEAVWPILGRGRLQ